MMLALLLAAVAHCPPVQIAVAPGMPSAFGAKSVQRTSANFASAYARACAEGLLTKPLVTVKGNRLLLWNAPDANVASIYSSKGRMLLEFPFLSGGKTNVPSADDLHEAIYCAAHGASPKEKEESGRCLPD